MAERYEKPLTGKAEGDRDKYTLHDTAEEVYGALQTNREAVIEAGRRMADLTIPSVFPPDGYIAGDNLPGNNQSMGAFAVNALASELMFMAFPPGQPIMKLELQVAKLQAEINQDPELYARTVLALSQLELAHRKKFSTLPLASAYLGYIRLLLVGGNALWRHITLESPTFHPPTSYVCSRTSEGHPVVSVLKQAVRVATMDPEDQSQIYRNQPELRDSPVKSWLHEADIYSVCRLKNYGNGDRSWCYWQEHKGELLKGTEVETDYDDCPLWPGWMIPVYGQNWGTSYCEQYRGDLFKLETLGSALNDLSALAAWALIFSKPGSRTNVRQLQNARNLDVLSGSSEDVSVFRSEKNADASFVLQDFEQAAKRVGAAFLVQSAVMRDGERVTKEEVQRTGRQLDRAMGGLYTEIAQGSQRRIITRAVRLHEEDAPHLPAIPANTVSLDVITGMDAMGATNDATELAEFGLALNQIFGPQAAAENLNVNDFATRMASYKGIKPDGLVKRPEDIAAERQQQQQQALGADVMSKAAGPAAGALAGALASQVQPQADQQQQ